jgi:hypothetical protein
MLIFACIKLQKVIVKLEVDLFLHVVPKHAYIDGAN